jgi:hypothetical protein
MWLRNPRIVSPLLAAATPQARAGPSVVVPVENPSAAFEATPDRTRSIWRLSAASGSGHRRKDQKRRRPLEEVATDERAHDRLREEPRRPIGIDLL